MADDPSSNNSFIEFFNILIDGAVGIWTFLRYPLQTILLTYPKMILGGVVKFIPALAVLMSGQASIQQEPVKRPDDHIASQTQSPESLDEANEFQAGTAVVSAAPVQPYVQDQIAVRIWWAATTDLPTRSPLPLIVAAATLNDTGDKDVTAAHDS
jgi:hypothetical protein